MAQQASIRVIAAVEDSNVPQCIVSEYTRNVTELAVS